MKLAVRRASQSGGEDDGDDSDDESSASSDDGSAQAPRAEPREVKTEDSSAKPAVSSASRSSSSGSNSNAAKSKPTPVTTKAKGGGRCYSFSLFFSSSSLVITDGNYHHEVLLFSGRLIARPHLFYRGFSTCFPTAIHPLLLLTTPFPRSLNKQQMARKDPPIEEGCSVC